jgi:hypothetical protein
MEERSNAELQKPQIFRCLAMDNTTLRGQQMMNNTAAGIAHRAAVCPIFKYIRRCAMEVSSRSSRRRIIHGSLTRTLSDVYVPGTDHELELGHYVISHARAVPRLGTKVRALPGSAAWRELHLRVACLGIPAVNPMAMAGPGRASPLPNWRHEPVLRVVVRRCAS